MVESEGVPAVLALTDLVEVVAMSILCTANERGSTKRIHLSVILTEALATPSMPTQTRQWSFALLCPGVVAQMEHSRVKGV
eukprot:3553421-Amphidinium_carterae.1